MKLRIVSDDRDHAILVGDEDNNDIAEFYHSDHATVSQSYETALALAKQLVAGSGAVAQSSPRCDRCGSSGDTYVLCSGCGMPASPPYPVQSALTECASRCRYDGDLFHDQGNIARRDASWKAANMAEDALSALNRAKDFPQGVSFPSTQEKSPIMQTAENAAKVVDGWSDAKKDYAERVTGASSISSTQRNPGAE
jgi:hypothetical protein